MAFHHLNHYEWGMKWPEKADHLSEPLIIAKTILALHNISSSDGLLNIFVMLNEGELAK